MKTYYKISFLLLFICIAQSLSAQLPDYYSGKDTVNSNNNTYKVTLGNRLEIKNINNFKMEHPFNSKGNPVPLYQLPLEPAIEKQVLELVKSLFNKEEIRMLTTTNQKGYNILYFGFIVDDRTGKVLEVSFSIDNTPATRAIPPLKFYILEQQLKQIVTYPHEPESVREFHTGTGINVFLKKLYDSY